VKQIPHGMTTKTQKLYAERLAGILNIDQEKLEKAMDILVREDVLKIAKNEIKREADHGSGI